MGIPADNNAKKVFISSWINNMGTGLMKVEGPLDAACKSITLTGKSNDLRSGTGREMDIREVLKIIDDKTQMMEMYRSAPDGKEF